MFKQWKSNKHFDELRALHQRLDVIDECLHVLAYNGDTGPHQIRKRRWLVPTLYEEGDGDIGTPVMELFQCQEYNQHLFVHMQAEAKKVMAEIEAYMVTKS